MDRCRRLNQPVNQYSHVYHLSRSVRCVSCSVLLVKDHHFVFRGHRCMRCWSQGEASDSVVESPSS
jgi:hypothetical protein